MNHANLVITRQRSQSWYLTVVAFIIGLLVGIYILGRYLALEDLVDTKSELVQLKQQLIKIQQALENASESLVMQKQSSEVDNQSNQELVHNVKTLQKTQRALEAELKFYRNIMAPERDQKGLEIDAIKIFKTDKEKEYNFRLTLIQAGKQSQFLKGHVIMKVSGLLNGKETVYDFRELGAFKNKHFQFQFKYFQNIQGFINLPNNFEIKQLAVIAKTKGLRKNQKAQKQIIWQPEESQNDVR